MTMNLLRRINRPFHDYAEASYDRPANSLHDYHQLSHLHNLPEVLAHRTVYLE